MWSARSRVSGLVPVFPIDLRRHARNRGRLDALHGTGHDPESGHVRVVSGRALRLVGVQ